MPADPNPHALTTRADNAVAARARARAEQYLGASKAPNTLRAYGADWRDFAAWCITAGRASMPAEPETVALYISDLAATAKASTIRRRLTTINKAHSSSGHVSPAKHPLVLDVFDGIRREIGFMQRGKTPLVLGDVQRMVAVLPDTLAGVRDRALLLVGFAGCFRRSEVAGLHVSDLTFVPEGVVVLLRRSKTDQLGEGIRKAIPYGNVDETCPVRALQRWLNALGLVSGSVFRPIHRTGRIGATMLTDRSVADIVKRTALAAGLDPALYAGHSLRSGFATQAAIAGVSERAIVTQGAWASERMARRYIRDANLFRDNAAGQVGL